MRAFATVVTVVSASVVEEVDFEDAGVLRYLSGSNATATTAAAAAPAATTAAAVVASNNSATTAAAVVASNNSATTAAAVVANTATTAAPTTTTAAPVSSGPGSFYYQMYSDGNCTVAVENYIGGPFGSCIDATKGGKGWDNSPAVKFTKVNATSAAFELHVSAGCGGVIGFSGHVAVGSCAASSTAGMFYMVRAYDTAFQGINHYIKYEDEACATVLPSSTGGRWAGLNDRCHTVADNGYGTAVPFVNTTCLADNQAKYDWYTACGTAAVATNSVPTDVCTKSSTTGYYIAKCYDDVESKVVTTSDVTTTLAATTLEATTLEATTLDPNATTTIAPPAAITATKKVKGSYTAEEDLPAGVTGEQLLASVAYKAAKQTGLANALSLAADKVTVTGFTVSAVSAAVTTVAPTTTTAAPSRRRLAAASVQTEYEIAVVATGSATVDEVAAAITADLASDTIAAAIQTQTNTAMDAQDWSAESVITTKPQITAAPTVAVPTTEAVAGVITSGPFTLTVYKTAACEEQDITVTGTVGTCEDFGSNKITVTGCTDTSVTWIEGATCGVAQTTVKTATITDTCIAGTSVPYTASCGAGGSGADATSSASGIFAMLPFFGGLVYMLF